MYEGDLFGTINCMLAYYTCTMIVGPTEDEGRLRGEEARGGLLRHHRERHARRPVSSV